MYMHIYIYIKASPPQCSRGSRRRRRRATSGRADIAGTLPKNYTNIKRYL